MTARNLFFAAFWALAAFCSVGPEARGQKFGAPWGGFGDSPAAVGLAQTAEGAGAMRGGGAAASGVEAEPVAGAPGAAPRGDSIALSFEKFPSAFETQERRPFCPGSGSAPAQEGAGAEIGWDGFCFPLANDLGFPQLSTNALGLDSAEDSVSAPASPDALDAGLNLEGAAGRASPIETAAESQPQSFPDNASLRRDPNIDLLPSAVWIPERRHRTANMSYAVRGVRYYPARNEQSRQEGYASWYGHPFHGRLTASGDAYNMHEMTAAHKIFPIPSYVEVTNLENGKKVVVRINDRGPFHKDRIIDLSYAAAQKLGFVDKGVAKVSLRLLHPKFEFAKMTILAASSPKNAPTDSSLYDFAQEMAKNSAYWDQLLEAKRAGRGSGGVVVAVKSRRWAANPASPAKTASALGASGAAQSDIPSGAVARAPIDTCDQDKGAALSAPFAEACAARAEQRAQALLR